MSVTDEIVEIKEFAQTVSNQDRLVVLGYEPRYVFFQQDFVLINQFKDQLIPLVKLNRHFFASASRGVTA
ncbi:MAG: hypothetical protein BWY75_01344 [bacterium ADurb.Bin425]|nr:MAG: hypothetical protein BWY75_01344 [bacterium ADurb.Bin425]